MTDTPETDNEADDAHNMCLDYDCQSKNDNIPTPIVVPADFARNLERERDELRAKLREEQQLHIQTLGERDEARQWESQALVARIQRDQFSKTLGEVREILCDALPTEDAPTSFMAVKLVKERDEARVLADRLAEAIRKHQVELPFRADFCDVELYEALATLKEARCES